MDHDDLYDGFGLEEGGAPSMPAAGLGPLKPVVGGMGGAGMLNPFARGPGTAMGPRGMTAARAGTSSGASDGVRPMTSVKGAGFQSKPPGTARAGAGAVDLSSARPTGPAPPLAEKADNGPEDQAKDMERKVHGLIEASAEAQSRGDAVMALERAKEAARKERALSKFRESNGLADSINMDLTYCVCFNLATAFHANKMYQEALNTYNLIVKNKQYASGGRLRVNMGNIYFEEGKYAAAVKMYRMALDQVPATSKALRTRIQRNIGTALVRLGNHQDAIQAFESIMDTAPEFQAGFNLVVCYFALGNTDLMRKGFQTLLSVPLPIHESEEEEGKTEDEEEDASGAGKLELSRDVLKEELSARQKEALTYVTNAAKLIAPVLEPGDWAAGYDWTIEQLRIDHASVASELQISKALQYLKVKNFERAIEELKAFEKKDVHLKARAATNLSFLYFLEGDMAQASKYANLAVRHDRYNAKALVNMGNCLMDRNELERAKELYLEAIGVEADCVEAIFNLGLVNKLLGALGEALQAFEKLHTLVPSSPEVLFQIASLHDMLGRPEAALKYFNYLLSKVPAEPSVLARMGQIYAKAEDETQAFHYHQESYRAYPVNLEVISWLGVWYVKLEMYEQAMGYFERASEIQPGEVKWKLMVASCKRRMGAFAAALDLYEDIHTAHPDNMECLRYLVALCRDLHRPYDKFEAKLLRLERALAASNMAMEGGPGGGALTQAGGYGSGGAGGGDADDGGDDGAYDMHNSGGGGGNPYASAGAGAGAYAAAYAASAGGAGGRGPSSGRGYDGGDDDDAGGGGGGGGRGAGGGGGGGEDGDRGFGSAADRFAAPTNAGAMGFSPGAGGGAGKGKRKEEEDDFADADLSDLLTE